MPNASQSYKHDYTRWAERWFPDLSSQKRMDRKPLLSPSSTSPDKKELGQLICEFSYRLAEEKGKKKIKVYQQYLILDSARTAMEKFTSSVQDRLCVPLHLVWISLWYNNRTSFLTCSSTSDPSSHLSKSKESERVYLFRSPEFCARILVHKHDAELEQLCKAIQQAVAGIITVGEIQAFAVLDSLFAARKISGPKKPTLSEPTSFVAKAQASSSSSHQFHLLPEKREAKYTWVMDGKSCCYNGGWKNGAVGKDFFALHLVLHSLMAVVS